MEKDPAISGDREQQRRDNIASRRQSGLEPLPQDLAEETRTKEQERPEGDEADSRKD